MYDYYKIAAYGIKLSYSKFVTTIQIVQMVLGIFFNVVWFYNHYKYPEECTALHPQKMIWGAGLMYGSYLFLFAQFYINRYNKSKKKKQEKKKN